MKYLTLLILLGLVFNASAQKSWTERGSETTAKQLIEKKDLVTETHAIFEKNVRIVYKWDSQTDSAYVQEEGITSVLSLLGGVSYYGSLYQSPNEKVTSLVGYYKDESTYPLLSYQRSVEDDAYFSVDGEYLMYSLSNSARFGEINKMGYTKRYPDLKFFTNQYFRESQFINTGKIEVWIPEWMDAELIEYHFKGNKIKKSKDNKVEWKEGKDPFSALDPDITYTVYTYDFENLDAFKSTPYAPGPTHYEPHLLFINKSCNYKGNSQRLYQSAGDLYKWYSSLTSQLEQEPSKEVKRIADSLTQNLDNDFDKIKSVFYWVQDNIRYIAFLDGIAGFKPDEASNVCDFRYGDCKGMANLTKTMLKHLGFDARLTWLGTQRIFYDYDQPTLSADNHMICTVILDGNKLFLDPTEKFVSINDYAYRIQGRQALIENGDSFLIEKIPEFPSEKNRELFNISLQMNASILQGSAKNSYSGESKKDILSGYTSVRLQNQEDALKRFLSGQNNYLTLSKVSKLNTENRESELAITFDFKLKNNIIDLKDKTLLQLDWHKDFYYLSIDKNRKIPFQFYSKKHKEYYVKFKIPNGYSIESLPNNVSIEREGYSFNIEYSVSGDQIIMSKSIIISNPMILPSEFDQWNDDIQALRASYDGYIILKK